MHLIEDLCRDRRVRLAALGFFAVSSGIAATIVNTDSLNLVWSCVWGCAGTLALLNGRMAWLGFMCYVVSIMCKESGLSWLAVGPLLVYAKDLDGRRLVRRFVVGLCLFASYLGLRFVLQGEVALGDGGDYALTLSPVVIGKNLAILVGMSLSAVDGLAWVAGRLAVFIGTIVLSGLMWGAFVLCVDRRNLSDMMRRVLIGAFVVLAFSAPHCLFKSHHPAEMHFYPVVLGGAFALALIPLDEIKRIPFSFAVMSMVLVFAIGWCDKMATIYVTSSRAEKLFGKIKEDVADFNVPLEYTARVDKGIVRYSVFSQSPVWCLDGGRALRSLNGWRDAKVKIVEE